ncbi:hypothetical protein N8482_01825 [Chitinophagales bacterium]|nr:hypothetical protein [Chitinophagales bacterium]
MSNSINIVSFDIPEPADYGGVIDVFYRIQALARLGISIHLHCFYKDRKPSIRLERLCQSVHYYKRAVPTSPPLLPYIVYSRTNKQLLDYLLNTKHPVLLEGVHCAAYQKELLDAGIKTAIRLHNLEWKYYGHLAENASFVKGIYFKKESAALRKFEENLDTRSILLSISESESKLFSKQYRNVHHLPAFHADAGINSPLGRGKSVLFYGNLSVNENEKAALLLCQTANVCTGLDFIIAGRNPSSKLVTRCTENDVQLIPNPSDKELVQLKDNAHVHLLLSEQETGVKLKLVSALKTSRFTLCNQEITSGNTKLSHLNIVNNLSDLPKYLNMIIHCNATRSMQGIKNEQFRQEFDNFVNAKMITRLLNLSANG